MMFEKLRFRLLILLLIIVFCSGCWDQVEIQQRAFVMGIGIDRISPEKLDPPQIQESGIKSKQVPQFLLTMEIPKLQQMGSNQSGGNTGGGSEKPAWTPSITGVNIDQTISELAIRSHREIYLGHLRAIVIGSDFARKEGLKKVMDFFFRYPEIQRQVPVFIANGSAKDVLMVKPPDDQLTSLYIDNITILEKSNSQFLYVTLGDLGADLLGDGNAVIGRIRGEKEEAVVGGSAIIKNWKFNRFLGEVETFGVRLLFKKVSRSNIAFFGPGELWYGVEIYNAQQQLKPKWDGKKLKMEYLISSEGQITEIPGVKQLKNQPNVKKLEAAIAKYQKNAVMAALKELQTKSKTDAIGLGQYIKRHWPKIWKKVGPRWEEEFPKVKITVRVIHKLRRGGVTL